MAPSLPSLVQRTKAFLTPTSSTTNIPKLKDGFTKAPTTTSLFPQVDPAIDGEGCDQDCDSCHIQYPKGFKIEEDDKLYGHVNGWDTHMVVATGKTDWVKDVQDEKGSVMEAVRECGIEPVHKLMLSASNMPLPPDHDNFPAPSAPTTVLLLPAFTFIDNVTPTTVPDLVRQHINSAPTTTTPLHAPKVTPPTLEPEPKSSSPLPAPSTTEPSSRPTAVTETLSSTTSNLTTAASATAAALTSATTTLTSRLSPTTPFKTRPCPHHAIILLCSQRTRDARCGQSAPLLLREFSRHLRTLGMYRDIHDERPGGVGVYFISHVGGHKYSANVMVYRRVGAFGDGAMEEEDVNKDGGGDGEDGDREGEWGLGEGHQCIWLARVRPEDCEGIVRQTVLKGKVVKPERQLRGGFDRERGLVSW